MELGNFSVSLTVRDLAAPRAFYEKLGFKVFAGLETVSPIFRVSREIRMRRAGLLFMSMR